MNSAKPMTQRDKVALYIYENGPKSVEQLLAQFPHLDARKIFLMSVGGGPLDRFDAIYDITPQKRMYFDMCDVQQAPYVGELARPADPALYTKPWSGKFSFANAPRREPIREVSSLNGGIGFNYGYQA